MATLDKIKNLGRQLYPLGRAFRMSPGRPFDKLNNALAASEARMIDDGLSILDSALPDNSNFTADDATLWERRLGLITNEAVSLENRKLAIARKMAHPGLIPARQHYTYLEGQLRDAGFDVYVHENRFGNYADGFTTILPESLFPLEGVEYITNGSFVTNTDWTVTGGATGITGGVLRLNISGSTGEQTLADPIVDNSGMYRLRIYWTDASTSVRVRIYNASKTIIRDTQTFTTPNVTNIYDIDTAAWGGDGEVVEIANSDPSDSADIQYISIVPIIPISTYPGLEENYYGVEYTNYVVNHIDPLRELFWDFGSNLRSTFFIGGQDIFDTTKQYADVDADRIPEFRQLILKIKPVQTKAFLLINEV